MLEPIAIFKNQPVDRSDEIPPSVGKRLPRIRTRSESRTRYYIRDEAKKRGWNVAHVAAGGHFLEENEITAFFGSIGLGRTQPDFLMCLGEAPVAVIEAKPESGRIHEAIDEAIEYAEHINANGRYMVRVVVGAAGEEDTGFTVVVRYLSDHGWIPLTSLGQEITTVPSIREIELALRIDDGSTEISIPANSEFIDAAIELSVILRHAKVEAPIRPKVIGAVVVAMYKGDIDPSPDKSLASINALMAMVINEASDMAASEKAKLIDALSLSGADFERLAPSIRRVLAILRRLNVRSMLHTDTDFLGMFYEAFIRYGADNNSLGIVFTPRHITRFCIDLVGVSPADRVIDIACGTGGFLVAASDKMIGAKSNQPDIAQIEGCLSGFDTNPTVWALSKLNMFFRGNAKNNIDLGSCFDSKNKETVRRRFSRAFLNPPFSQAEEPEVDFINTAMEALKPGGLLTAVVYAGVFADEDHAAWRKEFVRKHTLLAIISLPEELFYPTAAPTSIIVAKAHVPQANEAAVLMARIWNDGFEKHKNRRIERTGSQLTEVCVQFQAFLVEPKILSPLAISVRGEQIKDGVEWSPQQWLPQPPSSDIDLCIEREGVLRSIYQAIARVPDLADRVLPNFGDTWATKPALPLGHEGRITDFFDVKNGQSRGEKTYGDGEVPYVSSGDTSNSIIRTLSPIDDEVFPNGGLTVTAFGKACVHPWPFLARGNGGSAVRILFPKYNMTFRELVWFAAQINIQKWRFFYARMSIKSRLGKLRVKSPLTRLLDDTQISVDVRNFKITLDECSKLV